MGAIIAAMVIIMAIAGSIVWATSRPEEASRAWQRLQHLARHAMDSARSAIHRSEPHLVRARSRRR